MPSTSTDRIRGLTTSVAIKAPVQAVTNAAITLSGEQTVNGTAVVSGDRVLVKDQSNAVDNGIWVVSTGQWTRAADFDGSRDATTGTLVVTDGVSTAALFYRLTTVDPVIGTSELTFVQASEVQDPYPRNAAEIAAGVVPTDLGKPYGWSNRYATLQDAVNANAGSEVRLVESTTALGSTSLTIPAVGLRLVGESKEGAQITYSGTGSAIDAYGASNFTIENLRVQTTNVAANGIRLGNGARHIILRNVAFYGDTSASNTGTGVLCQAGSPGLFSGNLTLENVYTLGYKWGLKAVGTDLATNTWTTITGVGCYFLGRAAGVISGGAGIYFDALTNGIGSSFIGGTVESFDVGLKVDNGGSGFDYRGDLEGNTTKYTVGATYNGWLQTHNVVDLTKSTNGATNVWHQRRQKDGDLIEETYYDQYHVIYDASGLSAQWGVWRGGSQIDGGSPTAKFRVVMGTAASVLPQANFMELLGHRVAWHSAAPTGGTWTQGDVVWNTGVAAGGSPGWVCTTGGTPGTWKAMANVAV